jgi:hypothetical protein
MHPLQKKLLQLAKVRDLSKLSYREIGRQLADGDDAYKRVHPQNVIYHLDQLMSQGQIFWLRLPTYQLSGKQTAAQLIFLPMSVSRAI